MSHQQLLTELSQIKHESIVADVIRKHPAEGIAMLKDQIRDGNRVMVVEIVGENLVCLIEQLEPVN